MDVELERFRIEVAPDDALKATLLRPQLEMPGVLFVHGWGGSQGQDLSRARSIAALGCTCLTFDLRGHSHDSMRKESVTRPQNLRDLCAGYDWLAALPHVDPSAIAVVGVSYGGYLAALLTAIRPVRWLVLRTPALYLDAEWETAKARLHDDPELVRFRNRATGARENRALSACADFRGDVLLVEAERDAIIPRQVIDNFAAAFGQARSMTRRLIANADHAFGDKRAQLQYNEVLTRWMTEMVVGSREEIADDRIRADKRRRLQAGR